MLQELRQVSQHSDEPFRRWFWDETFDLIVWLDSNDEISGFQLCYRQGADQKALTWQRGSGYTHNSVDDGEGRAFRPKMTPILVADGVFDRDHILSLFRQESQEIESAIAAFVAKKVEEYQIQERRE